VGRAHVQADVVIFTDRGAYIAQMHPEWDRVMYYIDPDTGYYATYKLRFGSTNIQTLRELMFLDVRWEWAGWDIYMPEDLLEWLPEQ